MTIISRRMRQSEARTLYPRPLRERRKPATIGERQAASTARDIFADRQQVMIEGGVWPVY